MACIMLYSDGAVVTSVPVLARRRLRTRLFAGRCVLELPSAVGSDPRHFDLVAAQGGSRGLRQKLTGICAEHVRWMVTRAVCRLQRCCVCCVLCAVSIYVGGVRPQKRLSLMTLPMRRRLAGGAAAAAGGLRLQDGDRPDGGAAPHRAAPAAHAAALLWGRGGPGDGGRPPHGAVPGAVRLRPAVRPHTSARCPASLDRVASPPAYEAESSIRLASSVCRHLCGKRKAEGFSRVSHAGRFQPAGQLTCVPATLQVAIVRRSALAHGVVPTLAASGAALAVTVLRAGLAADAAVLSRILTLLKVALDVLALYHASVPLCSLDRDRTLAVPDLMPAEPPILESYRGACCRGH